ncbi:hypothetical protein F5H01DRAFT_344325 [Linnemannia elongata]|nr:hypothetical protein F5H01DRAFT_344325 [Linnemannia elongata]
MKLSWTGIALLCAYLVLTPSTTTTASPLPVETPVPPIAGDCSSLLKEWAPRLAGQRFDPKNLDSDSTLKRLKDTFPQQRIVPFGEFFASDYYPQRLTVLLDRTGAVESVYCG